MTPTREALADPKRPPDKRSCHQDFAQVAAAVAAAANPAFAVATTPPVPAGHTAGALVSLARGGA